MLRSGSRGNAKLGRPAATKLKVLACGLKGLSEQILEEEFGRHVEAAAEAFDVVFLDFALAAESKPKRKRDFTAREKRER